MYIATTLTVLQKYNYIRLEIISDTGYDTLTAGTSSKLSDNQIYSNIYWGGGGYDFFYNKYFIDHEDIKVRRL